MPEVVRSTQADLDLYEIGLYIARDSPAAAHRFLDRIEKEAEKLADFPGWGTIREDLDPSGTLRGRPVGNYTILYRRIEGGIELVRVVHGARDLPRLFGSE